MFHVILDPLLLWIGTDALGQFGSEAVEEGVLAQLDEILEGFPQEILFSFQEGARVWKEGASGGSCCFCHPGGSWPGTH